MFFKSIIKPFSNFYRIYCENAALKDALKLRTEEVKTLKAENTSKLATAIPLNTLFSRNNSGFSWDGSYLWRSVSCLWQLILVDMQKHGN